MTTERIKALLLQIMREVDSAEDKYLQLYDRHDSSSTKYVQGAKDMKKDVDAIILSALESIK